MSSNKDYREAVCSSAGRRFGPIFQEEDEDGHLNITVFLDLSKRTSVPVERGVGHQFDEVVSVEVEHIHRMVQITEFGGGISNSK